MQPLISIITVTYNAENFLEPTIQSVMSQSLKNIEHIIVDGKSKDETVSIIEKYYADLKGKTWITEKDNGLYDAMNKAHQMCKGKYFMYLNAGDLIEANNTLELAIQKGNDADVIYGDTRIIDTDFQSKGMRHFIPPEILSWKNYINGMVVCHQSMLVKKEITPDFDTQYKVSADIDWAIRLMKNAKSNQNVHLILTQFMQDGISTQQRKLGIKERYKVLKIYFGTLPTLLNTFKRLCSYVFSGRVFNNIRR